MKGQKNTTAATSTNILGKKHEINFSVQCLNFESIIISLEEEQQRQHRSERLKFASSRAKELKDSGDSSFISDSSIHGCCCLAMQLG